MWPEFNLNSDRNMKNRWGERPASREYQTSARGDARPTTKPAWSESIFQRFFVRFIHQVIPPKRRPQRIVIGPAKTKMQVTAPAFGMLKCFRHAAQLQRHIFHFKKI